MFILCTEAFLFVCHSFLLISKKFCDISIDMWGGGGWGGSEARKINCTGPGKLATIPLYNPLKSPERAHVHNGPLIDMALYAMLLIRASPPLGQGEAGWALEISTF